MTSKNSFWKLSGWNFKKRLWTCALCVVIWFFILPVSVFMQAGTYMQGLEYYGAAGRQSQLAWFKNYVINSSISGGGIYSIVVIGMAMLLALQGFSWINHQKKVDLFKSVPVKASTRFWYINLNSLWIFLLSFGGNMILANVAAALRGIWDGDFFNATLMSFFMHLLLFVAAYFLVLIAQSLTGNVVLGFCGAAVLLLMEPACFLLKEELMNIFYQTHISAEVYDILAPGVFTPIGVFVGMYKSVSMENAGFADSGNFGGIWGYAAVLVLQIVVYGAIAWQLYRKRPAQTGGKSMIFSKTKPVIKCMIMIVGSLFLGVFMIYMANAENSRIWYGLFGVFCGLLIMQVVLQTIMEGNFKEALGGKVSFALSVIVTLVVYFVFACDLTGYDTYLPKTEQVESFAFVRYEDYHYDMYDAEGNYISTSDYLMENMEITDQEAKERLISMLQQAIERGEYCYDDSLDTESAVLVTEDVPAYENGDGDSREDISVKFRLSDGREVMRRYYLKMDDIRECWAYLYDLPEYKEAVYLILKEETELAFFNRTSKNTVTYHTYNLDTSDNNTILFELTRELYDAMKEDVANRSSEMVMTQVPIGNICFSTEYFEEQQMSFNLPVYEEDTATIEILKREGWYGKAGIEKDDVAFIQVYQWLNDGKDMKVLKLQPDDPLFEDVLESLFLSEATQNLIDEGTISKKGYYARIALKKYGNQKYNCNFYIPLFPEELKEVFEELEIEDGIYDY